MNRYSPSSVYRRRSRAFVLVALASCSLASCGTPPGKGDLGPAPQECNARAIVTVRPSANIRNDFEFLELMQRIGVEVEIMHSMSRNSRMIRVRAYGNDEVCRDLIDQLRIDPRIESANNA